MLLYLFDPYADIGSMDKVSKDKLSNDKMTKEQNVKVSNGPRIGKCPIISAEQK